MGPPIAPDTDRETMFVAGGGTTSYEGKGIEKPVSQTHSGAAVGDRRMVEEGMGSDEVLDFFPAAGTAEEQHDTTQQEIS